MKRTAMRKKVAAALLAATVLTAGLLLPSLTFFVQDRGTPEQVFTTALPRTMERELIPICHMLRMAYLTDKQTILSTGKYLTPEAAFARVKASLKALEGPEFLSIRWDACILQDYGIFFRISSEDLSQRMILWSLTVGTPDGATMRIALDDKTGAVLGFSYSNPARALYTAPIPPVAIQDWGQSMLDFFTTFWGVRVTSTSVISDAGGYLLTVSDDGTGMTAEIPFALEQSGCRINSSG